MGFLKWFDLIKNATPAYAAQPYRQLASLSTASGHDREVRQVLMAQRDDQLRRATPNRRDRAWGRFTWWTLGYGYKPWAALIWLLGVVVISAVLTFFIGIYGLSVKDHPTQACSAVDRVVLGVDTAVPLITTPVSGTCVPRPNRAGQWMSALSVIEQAAGWAFATLFVAGFTGAVRKT
jgi:hypothetical protein